MDSWMYSGSAEGHEVRFKCFYALGFSWQESYDLSFTNVDELIFA